MKNDEWIKLVEKLYEADIDLAVEAHPYPMKIRMRVALWDLFKAAGVMQ